MHTPGPWELQKITGGYQIITGGKYTMNLDGPWYPSAEQLEAFEADARLIAAAPELYREFIVSIERGFALGYSCEDQLELYKKITGEEYDFDSAIAKGE